MTFKILSPNAISPISYICLFSSLIYWNKTVFLGCPSWNFEDSKGVSTSFYLEMAVSEPRATHIRHCLLFLFDKGTSPNDAWHEVSTLIGISTVLIFLDQQCLWRAYRLQAHLCQLVLQVQVWWSFSVSSEGEVLISVRRNDFWTLSLLISLNF